jgi:hypothetical protein
MTQVTAVTINTHVYCRTIYNRQGIEIAKMPHYQQMALENVVFMHNGILLSHKEE